MNDRPAVCVLYSRALPQGERHAELNVTGQRYDELIRSGAFVRATDFGQVVGGIERSLTHPTELAAERRRVAEEVVGEVDGRAAARVVAAILATMARPGRPRRGCRGPRAGPQQT